MEYDFYFLLGKIGKARKRKARNYVHVGGTEFKRKLMGICKSTTIKTLDNLSDIIHDIGMTHDIDEAEKMAKSLIGKRLDYHFSDSLTFQREGDQIRIIYNNRKDLI